jgi:transposase
MEIINGVERRRRWSLEDKLRIVAEAERRDAPFAVIARRNEVSRGLLWSWRRQVQRGTLAPAEALRFLPVKVAAEPPPARPEHKPQPTRTDRAAPDAADDRIEITLADGTTIRVGNNTSSAALRRVMMVLRT